MRTIRIEAPHFVAAVDLAQKNGLWVVVRAAPILSYMHANEWTPKQILTYCKLKHWKAEEIDIE